MADSIYSMSAGNNMEVLIGVVDDAFLWLIMVKKTTLQYSQAEATLQTNQTTQYPKRGKCELMWLKQVWFGLFQSA